MRKRGSTLGESREFAHQLRVAEGHIEAWNHRSYRAIDGEGVACTEPGCGWGMGSIERGSSVVIDLSDLRLTGEGARHIAAMGRPCQRLNRVCKIHQQLWPCRSGEVPLDA